MELVVLSDIRVLEISDPSTMLAGQILGDLGADVVTVEAPGGSPGRRLEPFIDNLPGLERSLTWHAFNRNKRGMTLCLDSADGVALLHQFVRRFDIVIEAVGPNRPSLFAGRLPEDKVHCTIAPFSMDGPKRHYQPADLVLMAASGAPAMAGEPGRAPLFFPLPQAMLEAGAEAAVAALAALLARERDSLGQVAHVSARTAAIMGALGRAVAGFASDSPPTRSPTVGAGLSGMRSAPSMYRCADGFMLMSIAFGPAFAPMTRQMVQWAIDEGALAQDYANTDWQESRQAASTNTERTPIDDLVAAITDLCSRMTKAELAKAARDYRFMAGPVNTMDDIAASSQFRDRGLFDSVSIDPVRQSINVPARFIQFSNYRIEVRRPAPALSQHTIDILTSELNLSLNETQALFAHGVI
jgi:crotonobetainyl-CoA:carnitine CoA-transferase CaiB-like acyl-CoA transferase